MKGLGFISGLAGAVLWGTVPLGAKTFATREKLEIDPLIFHIWNGMGCFAGTWVLLFFVPFSFSWWGILSAMLYVGSNLPAVFAIKYSGITVPPTIWGGVTALTTFFWDLLIFDHHPKNWFLTIVAFVLILVGIVGFSLSGSEWVTKRGQVQPNTVGRPAQDEEEALGSPAHELKECVGKEAPRGDDAQEGETESLIKENNGSECSGSGSSVQSPQSPPLCKLDDSSDIVLIDKSGYEVPLASDISVAIPERELLTISKPFQAILQTSQDLHSSRPAATQPASLIKGYSLAVLAGITGGSIIVPARLASPHDYAALYAFGIGMAVLPAWTSVLFWLSGKYASEVSFVTSPRYAIYGLASGIMYTLGNLCALYTVQVLGLSLGYSILNLCLVVTGLYGMIIWRELKGVAPLLVWFGAAGILICGTLILNFFG